jgi:hypothetical protein
MYQNPISKIDEHWKDNLIGETFNKRLEKAIHRRAQQETFEWLMDKYEKKSKLFQPRLHETVVVAALNPKNRKILDVGFNKPNDLILANFGNFLGGVVRAPITTASAAVNLNDNTNTARAFQIYGPYNGTNFFLSGSTGGSLGTYLQLGSGTTAATRADYKITTALGTAPESGQFATSNGIYGGGAMSFSGSVSAGGAGTVNETGFFGSWISTNGTTYVIMLFHDILSSGVAYVAGNILPLSYSIQM